ncbi:MAG: helix-turn-helix transcriptional regulator [Verrucomicrobia bacterium]|nr:helix-turn-helix transcriptional regulator [Verrucomicrobiota bacterium]
MPQSNIAYADYTLASPSNIARRMLWHVLGIGRSCYRGAVRWESLNRPGAVLLWVESGAGTLEIGSDSFALERGPRFCLFNLTKSRVFTPISGSTLAIQTIRFSGPALEIWIEELGVQRNPEFRLSSKSVAAIHTTHPKLWRWVKEKPAHWEWRVHLGLTHLLQKFMLARNLFTPDQARLPDVITRVLNAIATDPFRNWRANELAVLAGSNYSSFRALFREQMHKTIHEHLQRHRADLAQALLSNPQLQIKEIARRLHFNNIDYFSLFFRQQTGMSPTEFRRHLGGPTPSRL